MKEIHKEVYKGYTIRIIPDSEPLNPRTGWGTPFGTMVCFHGRYTLGDKHQIRHQDYRGWAEMEAMLRKDLGAVIVLPLYLYDHSGITMSTSRFSCPWDSGQVGLIYVTKEEIIKEYGGMRLTKEVLAKATALLESEVKTYDTFLRGEIYGYTLEDPEGNETDSCWGFYGDYDEEGGALAEAKSVVDNTIDREFKKHFSSAMANQGVEE